MDKELDFLKTLFSGTDQPVDVFPFLVQLIITVILSLLIGYFYIKYGNSLSNRKALSRVLVLVSLTTMIIITIVKGSLALSLGLVGALSIVRFRTAIKEPEELAYFFMVIAIGLGIGAGQILVTVIGTLFLSVVIVFINRQKATEVLQNLIIRFRQQKDTDIEKAIELLKKHAAELELRRLDEDDQMSEVSFAVRFSNPSKLITAKKELQAAFPGISFSFLEII